ncbi:DUF4012 domain-containing protein [Dactylosporangium aurantiacum]|uniref:DUF4012 domain-containing protein n=1 Tax=Dactylosporangium aurantiacum TaxID=35754 RepID=A0A9Q9IGH8_9ACTN|nr:DUF4012 domain-containing protein [Dactylosporangium aurantiacum]MDG6100823.1 DUF4012 domain-containing protein [Dactylosporangium aurantiacum]UWZ55116.1 DUF4012 domain-containing protein [Dactylosporangium aurantiacum]
MPDSSTEITGVRSHLRALLRTRRRRAVLAAAVVLVLAAGLGLRLLVVAGSAAGHLRRAATLVGTLERSLRAGDLTAARRATADLRRQTDAARADTQGLTWGLGTAAPVAGDDLTAVGAVARIVDDLADRVLPPLLDAAGGLQTTLAGDHDPRGLAAVTAAAPKIAAAGALARSAQRRLAALDRDGLDPRVRAAVDRLDDGLRRVVPLLEPVARAARLLPAMLGAAGPRTYLVLFQNLAEVRATGGMMGAYVVLRADRGAIGIVEQGAAATGIGTFPEPVLPLDPDQEELHTDRLGTFPADVNLTPDFPTAAALYREMYRLRSGRAVDGVLATDPVALAYLLQATGPVDVAGGPPLTGATAVRRLLSDVYLTIPDQASQDAFFAGAAKAVFDKLTTAAFSTAALVPALRRAAQERRLLAWSAHPQEQAEIAATAFAGTLPAEDGARPTVGVFLNDGTGAKLGYYLTREAGLSAGECLEDGSRHLKLTVRLASTAPSAGLPRSVLGLGLAGEYVIRTNVMVYLPSGGAPVDATQDGAPVDYGSGFELGRTVAVFTVDLAPGRSSTLELNLITGPLPVPGAAFTPRLLTTPGIAPWTLRLQSAEACGK